jgi:hypothetical protein
MSNVIVKLWHQELAKHEARLSEQRRLVQQLERDLLCARLLETEITRSAAICRDTISQQSNR